MMVSEGIHLITSGVTNLFVVSDSSEAVLIDAYWPSKDTSLLDALSKVVDPGELRTVILTHGHFDHAGASRYIKEKTRAALAAHISDAWMLEEPSQLFRMMTYHGNASGKRFRSFLEEFGGGGITADRILRDGDTLHVGSHELEIVHAPGHSSGSICIYDKAERVLFVGDTPVPSESHSTWLGLILDPHQYHLSLQRMLGMDIRVLAQAHGELRRGPEVRTEITKHIDRLKIIEETILKVLKHGGLMQLSQIRDGVVEALVSPRTLDEDRWTQLLEWNTIHAFLHKLCVGDVLVQERGLGWRMYK